LIVNLLPICDNSTPGSSSSVSSTLDEVTHHVEAAKSNLQAKRAELQELRVHFGQAVGEILDSVEARAVLDRHPGVWQHLFHVLLCC
jgi:hypothetical protein